MKITTSGESHGKGLFAIIEGVPAGLKLDLEAINCALRLRQSGYGRGARQTIERDEAEILTGVRDLVTLGSPITVAVWNRDYENWKACMAPEGCDTALRQLTKVRPGHADLVGMVKFGQQDARNVLERASARETAVRVAVGEICRQLLGALGIEVAGYVKSVGEVEDEREYPFEALLARSEVLGMLGADLEARAIEKIEACRDRGDTLGGVCELRVRGLKSGFGSCMTYAEKLDARLAAALMSVQAVKGVEVGLGFEAAKRLGSEVHDEIYYDNARGYFRKTNRAGGVEGGMSNGEELVFRAAMKPIPTLMRALNTVDTATKKQATAAAERSDVCAIFACERVLESAVCAELASVVAERLGGDTLFEMQARYRELPQ
ncbi:MAG: chorismate synthase [Clostridia bacterium]|nr:chorismate synthase [Clostridia bacterium]